MVKIKDCILIKGSGYYFAPDGSLYFISRGELRPSSSEAELWFRTTPWMLYHLEDAAW